MSISVLTFFNASELSQSQLLLQLKSSAFDCSLCLFYTFEQELQIQNTMPINFESCMNEDIYLAMTNSWAISKHFFLDHLSLLK